MKKRKAEFPRVKIHYDGSDLENVVIDNVVVSHSAVTLLRDLVRLDRYTDVGAAIRAGIRILLEENIQLLLANQTVTAGRLTMEGIGTRER